MSKTTHQHSFPVIEALQTLEEISGPDTIEQYIMTMVLIKKEIDERIEAALSHATCNGHYCGSVICQNTRSKR